MFFLKKEIFLNLLREIIIKFYSSLIILNILVIKKFSKYKLLYCDLGFGDSFAYYVFLYKKITNINYKILSFSHLDHNNASFLFGNSKIIKNFFFIPKIFPTYDIISYLRSKKIIGNIDYKFHKYKIKVEHKKLVENKLFQNINLVSKDLFSLKKKKYFLFFIKYYNNNINDLSGSHARQSNDFYKIKKILQFFKKKKINIMVLGNSKDKSIPILRNMANKQNLLNVKFLKDYSNSIINQLFVHYYSQGGLGSDSGAFIYSWFFKKKVLHFDTTPSNESLALAKNKNVKFLYKSVQLKKPNNHNKKKRLVLDNSYEEIIKNINRHLMK
jgi:hypothetical protein